MQQQYQSPFQVLLQFNDQIYFKQAMTFKQYHQEYTTRNKDNPLKQGTNEVLIDFGHEMIFFFFLEFLVNQDFPKSESEVFSQFSQMQTQKQKLINEKKLAEMAVSLGLVDEMLVSVNPKSELKDNPKIQAQVFKALIGAHYLDKKKDLNKVKKVLAPFYEELLMTLSIVKKDQQQPDNPKGDFQAYMDSAENKFELCYTLNIQEDKSLFDNDRIYKMQILINGVISVEKEGPLKKEVERQLYKDALRLIKDKQFQSVLSSRFAKNGVNDSWQTHVNRSIGSNQSFQLEGSSSIFHPQVPSAPDFQNQDDIEDKILFKRLVSQVLGQYKD